MNNNKKIVMCGCHEGGILAVESLISEGYQFSAFVCLTPEQGEKYGISGYHDFSPLAKKHNIPVYVPEKYTLDSDKDRAFFADNKFDLLIQGGWQRLFPEPILSSLSIGALGLHGSAERLPKGRGRSPMNWSLIEGRDQFLMHLFMIRPGVDDGDVLSIKDFDITIYDDIETMYYKYAISYRDLLLEMLPAILSGAAETIPQTGEPSYYPKRTPEDGLIDWNKLDVDQVYNFVRAQTRPYPGAFGPVSGKMIRIWKARPFDKRFTYPSASYGDVVERFENKLIVQCKGGLLLIDDWEEISL